MLQGSANYIWWTKDQLGKGATAAVYKCRNKKSGAQFAVKIFNQVNYKPPAEVQVREYELLRKLDNINIVKLYNIEEEQTTKSRVLIMEYCNGGSLFTILENPKNAFGIKEEEFIAFLTDVTNGLDHLHEKLIVHRDIKPGNIMLHVDAKGKSVYKLTDFGAARKLDYEGETFQSWYGTEEYLHPDLYERAVMKQDLGQRFDSSVDLWSMGVTIYHAAVGQLPFRPHGGGRKHRGIMSTILKGLKPGQIAGIQDESNAIKYEREFPDTCRISEGMKLLIIPLLSKLFDVKTKRFTFTEYYKSVKEIQNSRRVFVIDVCQCSAITIFLDKTIVNKMAALDRLKELIEIQNTVPAERQLLLFDHKEVTHEDLSYVFDYCTIDKPIFLFNFTEKTVAVPYKTHLLDKARFNSKFNVEEDYTLAKESSGRMHYFKRRIKYSLRMQRLLAQSVREFENYLIHQVLSGTNTLNEVVVSVTETAKRFEFFEEHCKSCESLLEELPISVANARDTIIRAKSRLDQLLNELKSTSEKVTGCMPDLKRYCEEYNDKLVIHRQLSSKWRREKYCKEKDQCKRQIKMLTKEVEDTMSTFRRDRQVRNLGYNEEQIHKFEKNKMDENCEKARKLSSDHCFANLRSVYKQFISWFSMSYKVFQKFSKLGEKLQAQRQLLDSFSDQLTKKQLDVKDVFADAVKRVHRSGSPTASRQVTQAGPISAPSSIQSSSLELSLMYSALNLKASQMQTEHARMRQQVMGNSQSLQLIWESLDSN